MKERNVCLIPNKLYIIKAKRDTMYLIGRYKETKYGYLIFNEFLNSKYNEWILKDLKIPLERKNTYYIISEYSEY